ncbi:hypothetical protein DFJ43DRAFT_1039598 [Lentinula guzmanii]|uniref:Uncharacterized protein n=2 Tax=Lentinula TaxID=5352 RepID=A0AA38JJ17_9AGAR|nr:hypothetical protein DFJ43DRAFT_1039598 [Lentinula guzmanii]KAJ3780911.1 hypothetical protein GGU10DRAFT_380086 [Lentinula aff. detonsa]
MRVIIHKVANTYQFCEGCKYKRLQAITWAHRGSFVTIHVYGVSNCWFVQLVKVKFGLNDVLKKLEDVAEVDFPMCTENIVQEMATLVTRMEILEEVLKQVVREVERLKRIQAALQNEDSI